MLHAGPLPDDLRAGRLVDRFGAQNIYGRPLGYREIARITLAENVERLCRKWKDKGGEKWFLEHPDDLKALTWAQAAYNQHGHRHP